MYLMVYVSNHVEMHVEIRLFCLFILFYFFTFCFVLRFFPLPPCAPSPPPQHVLDENMEQIMIQDSVIDSSSRNIKIAVRHLH